MAHRSRLDSSRYSTKESDMVEITESDFLTANGFAQHGVS